MKYFFILFQQEQGVPGPLFSLSAGQCVTGPETRFVKLGIAQNPELRVVDQHACFLNVCSSDG